MYFLCTDLKHHSHDRLQILHHKQKRSVNCWSGHFLSLTIKFSFSIFSSYLFLLCLSVYLDVVASDPNWVWLFIYQGRSLNWRQSWTMKRRRKERRRWKRSSLPWLLGRMSGMWEDMKTSKPTRHCRLLVACPAHQMAFAPQIIAVWWKPRISTSFLKKEIWPCKTNQKHCNYTHLGSEMKNYV